MNLPELLKIAEAHRKELHPATRARLREEFDSKITVVGFEELIKRLQEAEKDLKRYAWIQENWAYAHGVVYLDGEFDLGPFVTLDDVIDAAMNGGKE